MRCTEWDQEGPPSCKILQLGWYAQGVCHRHVNILRGPNLYVQAIQLFNAYYIQYLDDALCKINDVAHACVVQHVGCPFWSVHTCEHDNLMYIIYLIIILLCMILCIWYNMYNIYIIIYHILYYILCAHYQLKNMPYPYNNNEIIQYGIII